MPVQRRKQTRQSGSFDHRSSLSFDRVLSSARFSHREIERIHRSTSRRATGRRESTKESDDLRAVEAREAVATSRVLEAKKRKREGTWVRCSASNKQRTQFRLRAST